MPYRTLILILSLSLSNAGRSPTGEVGLQVLSNLSSPSIARVVLDDELPPLPPANCSAVVSASAGSQYPDIGWTLCLRDCAAGGCSPTAGLCQRTKNYTPGMPHCSCGSNGH